MTPGLLKHHAKRAIDTAAGEARLRYITDVPGQSAVYLQKMEQARAFIGLAGLGTPPPYITAEATATGVTPINAANAIAAVAALWNDQVGPSIEQARIAGKRAVDAAATPAAIDAAQAAALATLQGL